MWLAPTGWTGGRWAAWLVAITLGSLLVMADTAARQETASAAERSPGWGRYRDRDFGMAFDFPARIFPLKSAEQGGEGVLFSTPDGRARLRVFGFRNEANHTPRGYLSRIANFKQARFTYVRTTRRFFVASGTRDEMIFYRRCNFFRDKRVGCLQLDYPVQEKRAWDDIVTRISLSLAAADRNTAQIDSKSVPFEVDAENANSTLVANKQTRSSIPFGKKNDPVARTGKHTIAEKKAALPPAQLHHKADPITEKAKARIAAMIEDPASAEFGEIRRAVKSLRDEMLDTICGYVKGKNASGGETGEMPFLYIVQHKQAYLVDGTSPMAETVYGVLCN
jgi:hypothetical protein